MKMKIATVVGLALASAASAQVNIPAHGSIYTGFSRGFSFTAGLNFDITDLTLPTEAQAGLSEMAFRVDINGVSVYHATGAYAGGNISVTTGDVVAIIGNWTPGAAGGAGSFTASNSYGDTAAPYATMIEGVAHDLFRAGVQWDIGDVAGSAALVSFNGLTGSIGRINMFTQVPTPGSIALLGMGGLVATRRRRG